MAARQWTEIGRILQTACERSVRNFTTELNRARAAIIRTQVDVGRERMTGDTAVEFA